MYPGGVDWADAAMAAVTPALADRDARIQELEDTLTRIKSGIAQAAARDAYAFGALYYPTYAKGVQAGYKRTLRIIDRIVNGLDWDGRPRAEAKEDERG